MLFRSLRLGSAWLGLARLGSNRLVSGRLGPARLGSARPGPARLGPARGSFVHPARARGIFVHPARARGIFVHPSGPRRLFSQVSHEALFKREEHAQLHTHWNRTPTKLSKDRKVAQGSGPGLWHRARHRAQEPGLRHGPWAAAGPQQAPHGRDFIILWRSGGAHGQTAKNVIICS